MRKLLYQFLLDEDAASAIEYSLLAALISTAAFLAMTSVGTSLSTVFSQVAPTLH
jgi:pilus assembly protein Flp/PilA